MEISIEKKRENKSLQRDEFSFIVSFDKAVPSRKAVREAICASLGVPQENLLIISIEGGFGQKKARVIAHAYKSKEAMKIERRHLLVRDGLAEKKKKEEKPKGEKK
ncbi:MAG: hypothetical protein N3E51_00825 [Candidatus Micrarchaeota archaeon]|nr:hypothetical protein [Candidatus Micrarchaeota archaeon]